MLFHTKIDISKNKSLTPEGFLVCRHVPIARTGEQIYYEGEVPITPGSDGVIVITRDPEEVFHPEAIASFEGKPITMHHPEDAVSPENWQILTRGHAQNVMRGEGLENDALYADLLIMEQETIKSVMNDDIREISCGYDAEYEETSPGRGKQHNIRGNHIALVEKGRCGALCAIHDHKSEKSKEGGKTMSKFKEFLGALSKLIKDAEPMADDKDKKETKDEESAVLARLDKIENILAELVKSDKEVHASMDKKGKDEESEEAKEKEKKEGEAEDEESEEEKEKKKKAEDCYGQSKDAAPVMQEVLYRSSILAPELSRPTMDEVKKYTKKAFDQECCRIKRRSLDAAFNTKDGKAAIEPFWKLPPADFFTADCSAIDVAFIGASEVLKKAGASKDRAKLSAQDFGKAVTPSTINEQNRSFWDGRNKGGK